MDTSKVKPKDIDLRGSFPPFVDTFGDTEMEIAAAALVRTLQENGNEWKPVSWPELSAILKKDVADDRWPFNQVNINPFFRPDFHGLVEDGFTKIVPGEGDHFFEFTEAGLNRLERWIIHAS